jgi:hypothetical protein
LAGQLHNAVHAMSVGDHGLRGHPAVRLRLRLRVYHPVLCVTQYEITHIVTQG